jgi:S1-C subfamily serine protease
MSEIETTHTDPTRDTSNSLEAVTNRQVATSERVTRALGKVWNNSHLWRVATVALLLVTTFLLISTKDVISVFKYTDPVVNEYVAPRDHAALIDKLDRAVVTITCDYGSDAVYFGTAWAFNYEGVTDMGRTALITNHHVIEDCIDGGKLSIESRFGDIAEAEIDNYDIENDLAIVTTDLPLEYLDFTSYPPTVGAWVMAYGSADSYMGSVAYGNILNIDVNGTLLITANISGGNSGGPLVDNEGNVFGVNTRTYNSEKDNTQYNISVSLDSFCDRLLECNGDTYWDWD